MIFLELNVVSRLTALARLAHKITTVDQLLQRENRVP